nr:saccharopine dehydrogenase NADP-binding domain-containing protein [Gammaproteobacteria bacterium]
MTRKVLVLGGYGACGSHISRLLARDAAVDCVIGGRDTVRGEALADELGAGFVSVDIARPGSLNAALEGVFAVVNACGPFHWQDYTVAERCARRGVHYVDLATDRGYVLGITKLSPQAAGSGAAVVSGGGSLLPLSAVLMDAVVDPFDSIDRIEIAVSYGRGCPRGLAAMRALLYGQRVPAQVHEGGAWRQAP